MKYFILLISSLVFAQCPQPVDKPVQARGVFKNSSMQVAMEMATLLAQENLAKKILEVHQKELSQMTDKSVSSKLTTSMNGSIDGFRIISKDYNPETSKAEVFVELSKNKVNEALCK